MPVTNQQIFTELQEVKSSIKTLEFNQSAQGKQILDILLDNAKKEGKEEGKLESKSRRSNDKLMFWTVIASLATGIGSIVAVITLAVTFGVRVVH
jgi:hypothetical protein